MKKLIIPFFAIALITGFSHTILAQVPTSGLRLHLKADAGTSTTVSGQKVSTWTDQSGNGFQAFENNTNWQPTYIVENGISMLRFNSAAPTSMNLPKPSDMGFYDTDYEMFVVTRSSSQSVQFVVAGGINYNEIQLNGASGVRFIPILGNPVDNTNRADDGEFHIINSKGTTTEATLGIDGNYVSNSIDATTTIDVAFNLGTRSDGNYRLDGDIAEVIIYNRKLSSAESMQVSEYLKNKYSTDFTAYAAPGTSASSLGFSSVTQNSMTFSLTKGQGSHRIIVARKGGAVNAAPVDGVEYTGNASFGSGSQIGTGNYVVYAGTEGASTAISNLAFNSSYHFAVYEYNYVSGSTAYGAATTASQTTSDLTQANSLSISSRTGSTFSGSLTKGSGTYRLIVARQGSAVNQGPTDGVEYTGNAAFGSGSQIGTGNYVIYTGTEGTSYSMSSLSGSTVYHLAAFEYVYVDGVPLYRTSSPPTASDITFPSTPASSMGFSSIGLNGMTASFTPGNGNKRIVVAREGAAVSVAPTNGQTYSASTSFGSGSDLGSGNYVVYDGTGTTVALTGLSNSTTYHFAVYEYSEYGGTTSYLTSSPATGSQSTTVVPYPTISGATFGTGTSTSRVISGWVNPNGYETTVDIIYGTDPGNLNSSTTPQNLGSGSVADSVGIELAGLTTGQVYYAKLRAVNIRGTVESATVTLVPLTLTSLQGWYRGDIVGLKGDAEIDDWWDLSGLGNDLGGYELSPIPHQISNGINGKPVASFTGGGYGIYQKAFGITKTDIEIFIVFKSSSSSKQFLINYSNDYAPKIVLNDGSGVNVAFSSKDLPNNYGSDNQFTDGNAHILHYKGNGSKSIVRMDDGIELINNNPGRIINENNYIELGKGGNPFDGQIAEIFFFNAELPFEQRQEIAQYLSDRYSVSMFIPSVPETPASALQFSNVGANSFDVSLTKGNGERRIVVARLSGSAKTAPSSNSVYSANANFGSGSDLGNNNYVVYDGTDSTVTVTGLSISSEYTIDVYEYNNMELDPQYSTSSPNSSSQTTLDVTPPIVELTGVTDLTGTSATINSLVNPNSDQTSIQVFYGTDESNLSSSTSAQSVGSQSTAQAIAASLTGLSEETLYYYKISATNQGGTTDSEIASFVYNGDISLASLQFWVSGDGATFTTNSGDAVSNWGNQAGKATKAYQSNGADSPLRITDSGVSFLRFDGDSDFLELPVSDSLELTNNDYEIFIVAKSSSTDIGFLMGGSVGNFEMHTRPAGGVGTRFIPRSGILLDNPANTTDGNFHIFNAKATSEEAMLRIDGNSSTVSQNARSGVASNLILGVRRDGSYYFDGDIAEVLIYNSGLTDTERILVEQYLAEKYSVSLPYYFVNSTSDENTGSGKSGTLRYVLNAINTEAPGSDVTVDMTTITGTITLTDELPPINYNTTIFGPGKEDLTISGDNSYRPFFIGAGISPFSAESPAEPVVTLKDFTIANGLGKGGDGVGGAGGGAGMGGAVFVNAGYITINSLAFINNSAVGGYGDGSSSGGGGGGAFGSSGSGSQGGSGGLIGSIANGGSSGSPGGTGGFGGGGGAGASATISNGGSGGFGGGGGSGAYLYNGLGIGGSGGFGAGSGGNFYSGGGGGAGFGGAIFNRLGEIVVTNSEFTGNSAIGGVHNGSGGTNGSSYGGAIFNYGGKILELNVSYGTGGNANSSINEVNHYSYDPENSGLEIIEVLPVSNLSGSSVTINGTVTTLGFSGTYHIEYGTDITNLTNSSSSVSYTGVNSMENISTTLSALTLSDMYYYKIVVVNELETFESGINSVVYDTSLPSDSLQLWISADRGLQLSEDKLVNWLDASNQLNNARQPLATNQPVLVDSVINNKPVIRFNGSSSYLTLPEADELGIQNSDYELFIVTRSTSSELQFLYSGASEAYELHLNGGLGARVIPRSGVYIDSGSPSDYTNGQAYIINSQISSTSGGLRIDDELVALVNSNSQNSSNVAINLGRRFNGSYYLNGDVAEMIIYNKALSANDRESVVSYLSNKYDIETYIPSTPDVNASEPEITSLSTNSISGLVTKGNGVKRLILAKKGSAVDASPADDQVYTANTTFGSGTQIGTGNHVVYNGSDSVFTLTGLEAGNKYHFSVFEYNGTQEPKYLTSSVLSFSESTIGSIPEGLPGSAITFGGDDEDIMVPHSSEFNTSAVTMELWFKSDDSGSDLDFLTSKASEELEIHLGADGVANSIRFIPTTQVYLDSPVGVFTAGEWTHLAVVYDPSVSLAKMYINGEEVSLTNSGTNPLTTPLKQTASPFYLGSRASSILFYNGSMDEVRIWNKVRTVDEIREFMHRPIQSDYHDMIAYWQFNDSSGTTVEDKISGLDGALQNFEFNASNGWEDSEIAFGSGTFVSVDGVTSGTHALSDLSLTLTEDFDNAVSLTSNYLNTAPNVLPEITLPLEDAYWIVNALGTPGDFEATLTFTVPSVMISKGQPANSQFKLYQRSLNGTGNWTIIKEAASSYGSNTISFSGISELGQFTVGREINIEYAQGPGSALRFDGTDDYISIPDNNAFDVSKYTLELWFKWNEGENSVEFLMGKALSEFEIHTNGSNNSIRFIPVSGVFIDSPADAFESNTWTHLALVYDPSQSLAKMYFDGEEVTPSVTGSKATSLSGSSSPFNFGRRSNNSYYFNGEMDEVRLWNTVRTQAQIQQDMNKPTSSGYAPGLVAYWQFNEGTGSTTSELTSNLSGTLNNFDFDATSGWINSRAPVQDRVRVQTSLTGTEGWRLLATPVSDSSLSSLLSNIWTQGFTGAKVTNGSPNVFTWSVENGSNGSSNWSPLTDISNSPSNGAGALVYVFSDDDGPGVGGDAGFPKTIGIGGLEPTEDRDLSSVLNANANGWSLIGNPFKKDVDWSQFSKTSLSDVVYVYDNNISNWKEWSDGAGDLTNGEIGAFNAFFVQTTGENPSLTIPRSARLDSARKFLGKSNLERGIYTLSLSVENEAGFEDNAWFRISDEGDLGIDNKDAHNLVPLSTDYLMLGALLNDGTALAINNLPVLDDLYEFPLSVSSTNSGEHQISLGELSLPEGWAVQLTDKETGKTSDLSEPYVFNMNANVEKAKVSALAAPAIGAVSKKKGDTRFVFSISPNGVDGLITLPDIFALDQNYPNPFNPSTIIQYQLPEDANVVLQVFDILGRKVAELVNGEIKAGYHKVQFDARDLASGMYIYRLKAGSQVFTKKLTLIK